MCTPSPVPICSYSLTEPVEEDPSVHRRSINPSRTPLTFEQAAYFRALTSAGKTVRVEYRADEPSHAALSVETEGSGVAETKVEVLAQKPDSVHYTVDDGAIFDIGQLLT